MKTRYILLLSVILCLISLSFAQRLANEDETDEKIREIANKKNVGSLSGWVGMAKGIRSSATRGFPDLSAIQSGQTVNDIALGFLSFFSGLIALVGLSIIFSVMSCCACPCFFCCRSCGACGGDKPDPKGYDKNQKLCAIVTLGVGLLLVLIGFIIGLVSNSLVNQSLTETMLSINEIIDDAQAFPPEIGKSLDRAIVELDDTIDDVFDIIISVPNEVIGPGGSLTTIVTNMTTVLRGVQPSFDAIIARAKSLDTLINELLADIEQLSVDAKSLSDIRTGLQTDTTLPSNNNIIYKMNSTCLGLDELPDIVVANASGILPPISDQISQIDVDLGSIADQIDSGFNSIRGNFTSILDETFATIRNTVGNATSQAKEAFNDALNSTSGTFSEIEAIQGDFTGFYDENITPNNNYRSAGMIVAFCLNLLIIILCVVGFVLKKSPVMTAGICLCFFLMIIFWLLCLIHLILATPVGKICEIVLENQIGELLTAVAPDTKVDLDQQLADLATSNSSFPNPLAGLDIDGAINLVFDTLDHCAFEEEANLITFLGLDTIMDDTLEPLLDQAFNGFNFNDTLDSLQLPETGLGNIDLLDSLQLDTLITELEKTKDDFDAYVNLIEALVINSTQSKSDTSKPLITAANNPVVIQNCLIIVQGSPTAPELSEIETEVQGKLTNYLDTLNSMTDDTIPSLRQKIDLIRGNLTEFLNDVQNITTDVEAILDSLSGIDQQLQVIVDGIKDKLISQTQFQVRDRIYQLIDTAKDIIIDLGDCKFLGEDIYALLNSICITSVGGLDATWYTSGYLGVMLVAAIVGIALTAKRWIRADPTDQDFGDNYYKDKDYELPPMYSADAAQDPNE